MSAQKEKQSVIIRNIIAALNLASPFILQIYSQTSEKFEACFNIFQSECRNIRALAQIYSQTSENCASEWVKIYFHTQ